jgi:hypothetical protein
MRSLTADRLAGLLAARRPPCVSIYLPTSPIFPDSQQNPILYRDLLRQVEDGLRRKYPDAVNELLERLGGVGGDALFWTQRCNGLAVFAAADLFEVLDLTKRVGPLAVVADSFHVKPLLRLLQMPDRFQVLGLTRNRVRMFEGDRDGLEEIDLKGVPATMEEALAAPPRRGEDVAAGHTRPFPVAGAGHPGGHPAKGTDAKIDAEAFFQVVDRAVWERHSRPSGLPLILAALPVNQALFRKVSHNSQLLGEGVERDPDAATPRQLAEAAAPLLESRHKAELRKIIDDYHAAHARGQGSDNLAEVARAAQEGRVGALLIDETRYVPGTGGSPQPGGESGADLLDDIGEAVLRQKGNVLVVPSECVPSRTGLAAIYRY